MSASSSFTTTTIITGGTSRLSHFSFRFFRTQGSHSFLHSSVARVEPFFSFLQLEWILICLPCLAALHLHFPDASLFEKNRDGGRDAVSPSSRAGVTLAPSITITFKPGIFFPPRFLFFPRRAVSPILALWACGVSSSQGLLGFIFAYFWLAT